jgi:hypothetical protein
MGKILDEEFDVYEQKFYEWCKERNGETSDFNLILWMMITDDGRALVQKLYNKNKMSEQNKQDVKP